MSMNTLTSLAILKVNIDHDRDYLDYLTPFALHVLIQQPPPTITDSTVSHLILQHFGLEIPDRVVQIVLKRLASRGLIEKIDGVYQQIGDLPDPHISSNITAAERHINSVVHGLREYSQDTINPIGNDDDAVTAICQFLAEFDISFLRSYLRGTAIPDIRDANTTDIVLVGDYVRYIQRSSPERFDSFSVLVQGHMLANALTCPDLSDAPKNYKNVTFYCDTPLLVRVLGAEGKEKKNAARELVTLVGELGGKFAVFSHSQDELRHVLIAAANYVNRSDGRGAIVTESRRSGTTKADLILLAESAGKMLADLGIGVERTPKYIHEFQIDETAFEKALDDEVAYYNPRAKLYDINSVRSIYVLRGRNATLSLEDARAAFVTTNGSFASAARSYGLRHESSEDVSSVITDFALANMAWLKSPMKAPAIPTTQLLSFAYAALQPSDAWLDRYLSEIDRLELQGTITERDHQLLRSKLFSDHDLVHMTLGDETALTQEAITDTLARVTAEIKKEELSRFIKEHREHQETRSKSAEYQQSKQDIIDRLRSKCQRQADRLALGCSATLKVMLAIGLFSSARFGIELPPVVAFPAGGTLLVITILNLWRGSTVKGVQRWLAKHFLNWLVKRQSTTIGFDLEASGQGDGK